MAGSRASVAAAACFTQDGKQQSLECDFVVGADGSRTFTRYLSAPTSSGNARSPGSDPVRGAALVRRAHLRAVRPGFRADLRTTRAGRSSTRGWPLRAPRSRPARPSRGTSCCSAAASASRCSTAGCTWSATLRTPSRRPAPRSFSSLRIVWLSGDWAVWFRAGAGRRCSSSANRDERDNQRISIDSSPGWPTTSRTYHWTEDRPKAIRVGASRGGYGRRFAFRRRRNRHLSSGRPVTRGTAKEP